MGAYGRLGNQMFQIATVIGYSLKNYFKPIFPEWNYNKFLKHPLSVNILQKDPIFPQEDIPGFIRYKEPAFEYRVIPPFNTDVDLFGYFQSEKYWEGFSSQIQKVFELKDDLQLSFDLYLVESMAQFDNTKRICSIHVWRGDYITVQEHKDFYHELKPEYYYKAAKTLYGDKIDEVLFIICSDDPNWCRKNLKFENTLVIENSRTDIFDLFLMANCNDNIIANSSFSWWSAYLNKHKDKKVIAPLNWFKDKNINTNDLYCNNWIKI